MYITSGLSPVSGESLQCGTDGTDITDHQYTADHHVPESSHTVEIEYIYESPDTFAVDECEVNTPDEAIIEPSRRIEPKQTDTDESETDLTNLTWLQNITNIMAVPTFPIPPVSPGPPAKPPAQQATRLQKFNKTISKCQKDFLENRDKYRSDEDLKPPYSYSTLICMAMRNNNDKMTLSAIYSWIRENFKYYRNADPTWQNSIRHNLSLNKVFVKVARSKQEPGKGGFWKLDLAHLEGTKRISSRPHKKKKNTIPTKTREVTLNEQDVAVANIANYVVEDVPMPEFTLEVLQTGGRAGDLAMEPVGASVIVEPVAPPPLMQEEELTSLLLDPTDWDDLQLDMLDNYLDSCFK